VKMVKKNSKKKAPKKRQKHEARTFKKHHELVTKETRILAKLVLFLPVFIASGLLAWFIPESLAETIFAIIAILTGISTLTLVLLLIGVILAKKRL